MAGLFDNARPLDRYRSLLAPGRPSRLYTIESPYTLSRPGPAWQHAGILPGKWRDIVTERDPIYGAPQATERQTAWGIPGMATEMAGSLLNVLEAPSTGVMPTPADILNVTPMTSAPGLLAKIPAGAMASGMARRAAAPEPAARSPLGLFSPTEQAALDLKQTKLTPDQARASLANLGAKKEEMQWMGLDEFLAGRTSVTQDELIDFARRNRVEVEEVTYGGPDTDEFVRQVEDLLERGTRLQEQGDLAGARELFYQHDELMRRNRSLLEEPVQLEPRYSEYTLPGGENYREVVLKMPDGDALAAQKIDDRIRTIDTTINNAGDMSRYANLRPDVRAKVYAQRDKILQERATLVAKRDALGDVTDYRGGHFPDKNILAHVRMNDRIDADGKKVLFIEEIQSDWHQKGRQAGYRQPPPPITPEIQAKIDRYYELEAIGNAWASRTPKELTAEWRALKQDLDPWLDTQVRRVPDAPFKQTWSDLAMKRVMQMAADGGYDRVAWTTGRQQADRYDLSRQISEVHYSGSNFKAYDHDGATVISRTGVKESDLPDLIGKEAADKLMAQKSDGTLRSLVGQDLKVGGEGMFSFYDKMLPKKAQKIARRLDKDAKVGKASLQHGDVWSIDITPAMRGAAQQRGQPLFANPGAAAIPGLLSTQQPAPPPSMIMDNRQRIPRGLLDNAA